MFLYCFNMNEGIEICFKFMKFINVRRSLICRVFLLSYRSGVKSKLTKVRLQNDETHGMMRHMYSSNNNRSNNRHCMHLFLCQLILNLYLNWDLSIVCCKLFFSHFLNYVLCMQSNVKDTVKEVLTVDDFIRE